MKQKKYKGKIPDLSKYSEIGFFIFADGAEWRFFISNYDKDKEWMSCKVCRTQKRIGKANYSFGYNGERFAMTSDWYRIQENNQLYVAFIDALEKYENNQ